MRRNSVILTALAVVTLAIGAAIYRAQVAEVAEVTPRPHDVEAANARMPAAADGALADGTPVAHAQGLRFQRTIRAETDGKRWIDLRLGGRLWARPIAAGATELVLKIDEPAMLVSTPWIRLTLAKDPQGDRLELASVLGTGAATSASNPAPVAIDSRMVARFAADIADQFAFFRAQDLQGEYVASFGRPSAQVFTKRKSRYLGGVYAAAKITASTHRLNLSANGTIDEIAGEESLSMGVGATALLSSTAYRIAAANDLGSAPGELAQLKFASAAWPNLVADAVAASADPRFALEGVPPFEQLLGLLYHPEGKTADVTLGLFRNLLKRLDSDFTQTSAQVRAHAESLGQIARDANVDGQSRRIAVGALASSVRGEAQSVLREVFSDPTTTGADRQTILNAWTTTGVALPPATTQVLRELAVDSTADPLSSKAAMLALGAQAERHTDPDQQSSIENFLLAQLQGAQAFAQKVAALEAVGNAGSAKLLPAVKVFVADADDRLRAKALMALRKIPGTEALALIQGGVADEVADVRRSAQLALNLRHESGLAD